MILDDTHTLIIENKTHTYMNNTDQHDFPTDISWMVFEYSKSILLKSLIKKNNTGNSSNAKLIDMRYIFIIVLQQFLIFEKMKTLVHFNQGHEKINRSYAKKYKKNPKVLEKILRGSV